MNRCEWSLGSQEYIDYHDNEWGVPIHDDQKHFEFLVLEGAQAGLSWATILKRRDGYKNAFANFDVNRIVKFDQADVERLLNDPGIIRNKLKIHSVINNAKCFIEIQKEFGSFDKYIWNFVNNNPIDNKINSMKEIPATSKESDAVSKHLKKRGFKFVGSTIIYAYMQACGLVNDHATYCFRHNQV